MTSLEALLGGRAEEFRARAWPSRRFQAQARIGELPGIAGRACDVEPAAQVAAYRGPAVSSAFDLGRMAHVEEPCSAAVAARRFESGAAVKLMAAHRVDQELGRFIDRLAGELGLPGSLDRGATLFVAPPGARVPKHCDPSATFIVQLRGKKRWQVAPNLELPHPTRAWAPSGPAPHPELAALLAGREVAPELPDDAEELAVAPGETLFMPWGEWHATRAGDDPSISLSIYLDLPSRMEHLLAALRSRLIALPAWRAPGALVDPGARERAEPALDAELGRLIEALAHWGNEPR